MRPRSTSAKPTVSDATDCGTAIARQLGVELNVTGEACVMALLRAGFRLKHRGNGLALLKKDQKIVMVPDVELLEPEMLRAILRSADLDEAELARHLMHAPLRSGFFAKSEAPHTNGKANGEKK